MSGKHLGSVQKKILDILEEYPESTALKIAETVYGKKIQQKWLHTSSEYCAVNRALHSLEKKHLVERLGGRIKWRLRKTK